MSGLSIVHLASELAPLVKVGGLADVVGALSLEQARRGHRVRVVLPGYQGLQWPAGWRREPWIGCEVPWGMGREPARFERAHDPGGRLEVLLIRQYRHAVGGTILEVPAGKLDGEDPALCAARELEDLYVDPDWMRRGIATRLIGRLLEEARRDGVRRIEVTARIGRQAREGIDVTGHPRDLRIAGQV